MKAIKPKILLRGEVVGSHEDIIKNRQKFDIYEAYTSKNLILWLLREKSIDEKMFLKLFNFEHYNTYHYYDILKKFNHNDIDNNRDFDDFDKVVKTLNHNLINSDIDLYKVIKKYLSFEVFTFYRECEEHNSIILKNMDYYVMVLNILHYNSDEFSEKYVERIKALLSNKLPENMELSIFKSEKILINEGVLKLKEPHIIIDADYEVRSLDLKKYAVLDNLQLADIKVNGYIEVIKVEKYG
ncbi:hypothetical protein MXM59_07070 [Mammaliicoccus sciuri]|uniref:hypothetical protein n=1 Tax=Mammaliicoccus sciuri TaxID=1296 RepID=UPI002DB70A15|nr:hypothetical protein [Mammaliicoccus sciuri]MEB6226978.1 hypothetical protein [Mammaliicoccus sciuri]